MSLSFCNESEPQKQSQAQNVCTVVLRYNGNIALITPYKELKQNGESQSAPKNVIYGGHLVYFRFTQKWARSSPSESGEYGALVCKGSTQTCNREGVSTTQGSISSIVDNLGKESAEPLTREHPNGYEAWGLSGGNGGPSFYDSQPGALDNHGRNVNCIRWADARCRATSEVNTSNVINQSGFYPSPSPPFLILIFVWRHL